MKLLDMKFPDLLHPPVLIVPGLHGSGPEHWQTRWQQLYPNFKRVEQKQWDVPDLEVWSAKLSEAIEQQTMPVIVVAHSFGCLITIYRCARQPQHIAGALLVGPADPHKFHVEKQLADVRLPFPAVMIGSTNDPWMAAERAAHWAQLWGCEFINAGALGHINADSGLEDWPFGLKQLHRLVEMSA